jgi:hypothetical protein
LIVHALALAAVLSLGRAESFSILGGSGVTASGPMRVTGNVGAGTGGVTGVSPVVGEILPGGDALKDVATAWDALASDLSVQVVSSINPDLVLSGDNVWIFHVTGDLTTLPCSSIHLRDGAKSSRIFWLVDGSATLGEQSSFAGTLIAQKSITAGKGVTVSGRLFARQGTVTLTTDDINFCCDPIEFAPLPPGAVNTQYQSTIFAGGGTPPRTFSLFDGALPPNLNGPDPNTGTLSGVPTAPGSYTFIVMVKDYKGCTSIHTYTIVICDTTTLEPVTLPDAVVGAAYSVPITASGGMHRFKATDLPDGMSLSPDDATCATQALLCGTPIKPGIYKFKITATSCDGSCSGSRYYTIGVLCPKITVLPESLSPATVGTDYERIISVSGGREPYRFEAAPSSPPGVIVGPLGTLSFKPTNPGRYSFSVTATDAYGCFGQRDYTIDVVPCPPVTITPATLLDGTATIKYTAQLDAGSYTFVPGLVLPWLDLSITGNLSGTPPAPGDYCFTVTAIDSVTHCSVPQKYKLHVNCPTITISPADLPHGTLLVFYKQVISVTGGTPPYDITVTGSFPPGITAPGTPPLTLPQTSKVTLSGFPMASGSYTFTVTATDSQGCIGFQTYTIVIRPPLVPGPVIPTLSEWMLLILAIVLAGVGLALIRREGP